MGVRQARKRFIWDVLRFFNYGTIKGNRTWNLYLTTLPMYTHFFKSAFRNFSRNKAFTFLNLLGLTLGLVSSMLIGLWVYDELTFDHYLPETDHVYQVMSNLPSGDGLETWVETPQPLASLVDSLLPEVRRGAFTLAWQEDHLLKLGQNTFKEKGLQGSQHIFEVLPFSFIQGDPAVALEDPDAIVISGELATKLMGPEWHTRSLMGTTLQLDEDQEVKVTGVFERMPSNATHQVDFFIPVRKKGDHWGNYNYKTYLSLLPETDIKDLEKKVQALYREKKEERDPGMIDWDSGVGVFLHSFQDVYLYSNFENGKPAGGRIYYVRTMSLAALVILLIACINYMNLSTSQSLRRAKEIGVRKVIGARKKHLISQFILEAVLLTLGAIGLSLILVHYLLPPFNSLMGKEIHIDYANPSNWMVLGMFALLTGLLAGSYPSFFLSSFQVSSVLKGMGKYSFSSVLLRKGLVVGQFVISLALIIVTLGIHLQLSFFQSKNLGYDREGVVYTYLSGEEMNQKEAMASLLEQSPYIDHFSFTSSTMLTPNRRTSDPSWEGKDPNLNQVFSVLYTDNRFIETFDIPLTKGRNFSPKIGADKQSFLINELAAEVMGMEDPIGKTLDMGGFYEGPIVGVIQNFHQNSLHIPLEPIVIENQTDYSFILMVKPLASKMDRTLADLKKIHEQFSPKVPFEYHFLDQGYDQLYQSERMVGTLTSWAAGIAIIISCLGLFGLALFTSETRTREISIRKVLGATLFQITQLLTQEYTRLILISIGIAIPLSIYILKGWLDQFAYQTELKPWIFIASGVSILLISFLTIAYQALRMALANPVEHLYAE